MPREFHRSSRVAEQIHRTLGELLNTEVNDQRLETVTLTHVSVSRDLAVARVFFAVRDGRREEATAALKRAAGFLRRELSQRMNLRTTPELRFEYDEALERGDNLSALIATARAEDRRKAGEAGTDGDGQKDDGPA